MSVDAVNTLLAQYRPREIGAGHPVVAEIRKALAGAGDLCVLDGYWALGKAADAGMPFYKLLICPAFLESDQASALLGRCLSLAEERYLVSAKTFEKLSERDGPCGIIALSQLPSYPLASLKEEPIVAVLDGLETPGNIGTILRTCDGAGIGAAVLVNSRVRRTHPKLIKSSMGAAFSVKLLEAPSVEALRAALAEGNFSVYLADTRAEEEFTQTKYHFPCALIAGNERYGISRDWYDGKEQLIKIPMRGTGDSLNVGVAASIFLYTIAAQRY